MERNQLFNNSYYSELKADLKTSMAEFKVNLENLKQDVDTLSNTITALNKDSTGLKTKMDYIYGDIEQVKAHSHSVKTFNDWI